MRGTLSTGTPALPIALQALFSGLPIDAIGNTPRIERGSFGDEAGADHPVQIIGRDHGKGYRMFNLVHDDIIIHPNGLVNDR